MKKITVLLVLAITLGSCGPYQKALKKDEVKPKYELAVKYYKEGIKEHRNYKLKRTLRLLEQILPQFRGKPQGEHLAFMYANTFFILEDYIDSGYQFERFTKSFSNSDKVEEAAFKSAKSYYYLSPRFSLDQTDTEKALAKLQLYLTQYPGGEHVGEANQMIASLRLKLEKKKFKIAKLYYVQEDWKAAVAAMDNFINANPGSPYLEEAYYYKMDAEHVLAINSYRVVMEERLNQTKDYAEDYIRYYPEGEHLESANTILEDVNNRLKNF